MTPRIIALTDSTGPAWIASAAGAYPVGAAFLGSELEIQVHPASRRRGVGTRLLEAAVAEARRLGRRSVVCTPVEVGSPGDAFLAAHGLRPVLTLTYTRLDLAGPVSTVEPTPGYRLVAWEGLVPDELANSFTASRRAMDDMPMDDADVAPEPWDADRVRRVTAAVARRGDLLDTVAVVAEATGEIVGFTELVVPGSGTGDGQHYGTGVLPAHRGRGLARWMKAESVRRARRRHPALSGLLADTADSNAAMRRINNALGYVATHRSVLYQLDLPGGTP
ncbi:MAG TPA: GNAT family N-acetyltransferase [Actinoplanes sp.]|jgi:GNAT superfamily N-acetyltransferase|nr:GNAT family N-acetyltransferase [Actinoplanes sp.]